jgi:hypothetical protein
MWSKKADAGFNPGRSRTIEVQGNGNIGFACDAMERGLA